MEHKLKSLPKEIKYSMTLNLMEETQLKVLSCMHIKQKNYVIKLQYHSKIDIKTFQDSRKFPYDCGAPPIPKPTKQRKAMIQ